MHVNYSWEKENISTRSFDSFPGRYLKGTNTQHSGHMGQKMVEIYSKSLVRAIGITHEILARTPI